MRIRNGGNAHKTWGNKFIENLSRDLRTEYPDAKGLSVRNLKYMAKFTSAYPDDEFVQTVSAQISWSHNIAIPHAFFRIPWHT